MEGWRVDEWLETFGLGSYLNDFIDNGYEKRELCANLKPDELDAIGVKDKKHRTLLLDQAKLLLLSNGSGNHDGVTPQNYSEPWEGNKDYTEPWQQKPAGDKKTERASASKGREHASEAVHQKKKGHATLPASITKHHRSVQASQLPHFVNSTGELTKLQLKLKMKEVLQKDRIVLSEPPYVSADGALNQPVLEELASHYGEAFAIDSERVFEALKEVWDFSMNISAGPLPAQQQHQEKSRTLPSSTVPISSDYQEPFKAPEPDKASISKDKMTRENTPIVILTPEKTPKQRPYSMRLQDSKSKPGEPMYEEMDTDEKKETPPNNHFSKRFSHAGTASPSHEHEARTSLSSVPSSQSASDDNSFLKKTKPPNEIAIALPSDQHDHDSEESQDTFPAEPGNKHMLENGNEGTRHAENPANEEQDSKKSGGFMTKLLRRITTKHPKSLSHAPGSPKLPSSKSMPAIADTRVLSKSSDDLLSSEYSEVFDKVPLHQPQKKEGTPLPGTPLPGTPLSGTPPKGTSHLTVQQHDQCKLPVIAVTSTKGQESLPKKESDDHSSRAGSTSSMDRSTGDHTLRAGSTGDHTLKAGSTEDHTLRVESTSVDRELRAGSYEDIDDTCPIPTSGSSLNAAPKSLPKPLPRQSKKKSGSESGAKTEAPPMKPKRSTKRSSPLYQQGNMDNKPVVSGGEQSSEPQIRFQSLPAPETDWEEKPLKPKPLPKPRPRTTKLGGVAGTDHHLQGDGVNCQPP